MQNISRDARELTDAVDRWLAAHPQLAEEADRLRRKVTSLHDWVKLFRRKLSATRRHDANHPVARAAADELLNRTRLHLRTFGALTLRIGPADTTSEEGIPLPQLLDGEHEGHTFYCLFRDGICTLQFKPGIEQGELDALLEVVAANGRRDGDDAVTWLWSGRHRHIRIEVESSIGPRLAAMLFARSAQDVSLAGYVGALRAALPDHLPAPEALVGREHAASLAPWGVDPAQVELLLTRGAPATAFPQPDNESGAALAHWFSHQDERLARYAIIRHAAGVLNPGGQP